MSARPAPAAAKKTEAEQGDFARMEIRTPFDAAWLRDFLADPEPMLRVNPLMEFSAFDWTGPDAGRIRGRNLALERDFDVTFRRRRLPDGGFRLTWEGWLKTATEARIEENGDGAAKLIVIDDYSAIPEKERRARVDEVDTTFNPWGQAIHRYLARWRRWSWLPGWKWFMGRYWLRMKPSARRISFILAVLALMEFGLFLFVLLIFWLELPKYMN